VFQVCTTGGGMEVLPIHLPHDLKGTIGFVVSSSAGRIGYATDLGRVPGELIDHFSDRGGVDLLAIESNYDPVMQYGSSRPAFLKQRIMGGKGHLSNEQAFTAVRQITARSGGGRPGKIVLLHRSSRCNCPTIVQRVFDQDPAIGRRVVLAQQRRRSRWLSAGSGSSNTVQMAFGF
jgi:phosphoribosyl 1,2-cyclic phosphodiesterase